MPEFDFSPLEIQFLEALALILIACLTVPVFKRIGFGTILGYLAAGVILGASLTLGFTEHPEELLHFAEFGVVLFLFVIGLGLSLSSTAMVMQALDERGERATRDIVIIDKDH